jgi:pheromone shutdown protein TraB
MSNRIWNRDFSDWFLLLLGVFNLIVALFGRNSLLSLLNAFAAGWVFSFWFLAGIFYKMKELSKSQNRLIEIQNKYIEELRSQNILQDMYNSAIKKKGRGRPKGSKNKIKS